MRETCAPCGASSKWPPEVAEVQGTCLRGEPLPCIRKADGTRAWMESGSCQKPCTASTRHACGIWRTLDGLHPSLQWWHRHPRREHGGRPEAIGMSGLKVFPDPALTDGRGAVRPCQETHGAPTSRESVSR